ncbi:UNVERIFIED_CONTAM: hypothetical protein K2H54_040820 [Gekko kuhli]
MPRAGGRRCGARLLDRQRSAGRQVEILQDTGPGCPDAEKGAPKMAESAAAAAPSSGPGGKGSASSGTWWKSLTSRKKPKETPPPEPSEPPFAPPSSPSDSLENQPPTLGSGSRRNLKISRSGRFKEKRKVRATLLAESPQQLFEGAGSGGGGGGGSSATPALSGEESPCP